MKELLKGRYQIKNKSVILSGEVYQNDFGCYIASFDYWHTGYSRYATDRVGKIHQGEFSLNGPSKGKLEKKIVCYLYVMYK